jgi:hypothetical protein
MNFGNIRLELTEEEDPDELASSFYADYDFSDDSVGVINEDFEKYNVKQLLRIYEYYQLPKQKKPIKKVDLIQHITQFESNYANIEIVERRTQLWSFMSELMNDKYMKQFLFWS